MDETQAGVVPQKPPSPPPVTSTETHPGESEIILKPTDDDLWREAERLKIGRIEYSYVSDSDPSIDKKTIYLKPTNHTTTETIYAHLGGTFENVVKQTTPPKTTTTTTQEVQFNCPRLEDQERIGETAVSVRIKKGDEKYGKGHLLETVRDMGVCVSCPYYNNSPLEVAELRESIAGSELKAAQHKAALDKLNQTIPQAEI